MSLGEEYARYLLYKLKKMRTRKTAKGIINDLIDLALHPLFGRVEGAEVLDIIAHTLVDGQIRIDKIINETIKPSLRRRREWKRKK